MANFNIDNLLESLSQSGLAGVTLNDNAAPLLTLFTPLLNLEVEDQHLRLLLPV